MTTEEKIRWLAEQAGLCVSLRAVRRKRGRASTSAPRDQEIAAEWATEVYE